MPVGQHVIMFLIFYFAFTLIFSVTLVYGLADYIGTELNVTVPSSLSQYEYSNESSNALDYVWDTSTFMFSMVVTNPFESWSYIAWFWILLTIIFIYILIVDLVIPALDLIPFT